SKSGTPKEQIQQVDAYYGRMESEMVKKGVSPERARELVSREKTSMYDDALSTSREMMEEGIPGAPPDSDSPNNAAAATHDTIQQATHAVDKPLRDVQILRSVQDEGGVRQVAESGYKLVSIDPSTKKATVINSEGARMEVSTKDLVFVHDGQALGAMPAAIQKKFVERFAGLGDKKEEWVN